MDYYHTCAGCNDAVLVKNETNRFAAGYIVEDVQYFDYDGQNSPEKYGFGFIPTDEGVEQGFWFVAFSSSSRLHTHPREKKMILTLRVTGKK